MTVMNTHLLTLKLRGKRSALLVRQRARQVAGLLGFGASDKARIAALAFRIAEASCTSTGAVLRFQIEKRNLHIFAEASLERAHGHQQHRRHGQSPRLSADGTRRLVAKLKSLAARRHIHLSVEEPLPEGRAGLVQDDVPWLIAELERLTPLDVWAEVCQQNEELLEAVPSRRGRRSIRPDQRRRPAA
jgi:hypothetical protein